MLVLASQSPRRRELLTLAGFEFIVRVRPVAEIRARGESARDYVRRLAREKAHAAHTPQTPAVPRPGAFVVEPRENTPLPTSDPPMACEGNGEIVLGADTVVVLDAGGANEQVLEKPRDVDDARAMLRSLSGRDHVVMTGIALLGGASASASPPDHANRPSFVLAAAEASQGLVRGEREIVDVESTRVHFVEWSDREIEDYVATGEPMDKAGAYAIQGRASKFVDRIEGCYFNVMGLPLAMVYRHWKTLARK